MRAVYSLPGTLPVVQALAGDSTMTRFFMSLLLGVLSWAQAVPINLTASKYFVLLSGDTDRRPRKPGV